MAEPGAQLAAAAWRFLAEESGVVVLLIDASETIRFANARARALTGLPLEGGPLGAIVPAFQRGLARRWREGGAGDAPYLTISTAAGLPETLRVTPVALGEETLLFCQPDAEEQAKVGREFLALNRELANLSRELAQKNAELAELSAQKTRFLGMATHDLRKPAGLVLSYAELLREGLGDGAPPEQLRLLETIRSAAGRMSRVIDDFLDVAVIEAGRLSLDLAATTVGELLLAPLQLVGPAASRRGIRIETGAALPGRRLLVDGPKIEQVLTNLLSNAIEHAPDGSAVRVEGRDAGPGFRLAVTDAGPGIPAAQRARLFSAFDSRGGRKRDGERSVGLGLAISRRIVEAHGGRMFVEDPPDGGAAVGFTLPEPRPAVRPPATKEARDDA